MTNDDSRRDEAVTRALDRAAAYGRRFRRDRRALHPTADVSELRRLFDVGLPNAPHDAAMGRLAA